MAKGREQPGPRRDAKFKPVGAAPPGDIPQATASSVEVLAVHQSLELSSFSGPLPPPQILIEYNKAVPSAADRIIAMAEAQAEHRRALEAKVIGAEIIKSYAGLAAAFVLAMTGFGVGGYVVIAGHDWAGAALVTGALVGLVYAFLRGHSIRQQERTDKAHVMKHVNDTPRSPPPPGR